MIIDIYLRVSKARKLDDRYQSLEGQETVCRARVRDFGAELGQVHRDRGLSAWNPKVKRPGWDALMTRLESRVAGGVCVFDVERFSRRPIDGERLIEAATHGLLVLDADGTLDLSTASGKKSFRDGMSAAAYYSDRLRDRTARGKRDKAKGGLPNVAARPFGFEPDGMTVRPDEASALRACAELMLRGESLDRLIAEMDSRGLRTSYGCEWTRSAVRRVLERPRNAGLIVYQGEVMPGVALPGEPILDRETYDRLTLKLAGRKAHRPASERYLLSGIATCGTCGRTLAGRPRRHHSVYDDGTVRRQYWCGSCKCPMRVAIDMRWLDSYVERWATFELADSVRADSDAEMAASLEAARSRIAEAMAAIEEDLVAVAERVGAGEMSLRESDAMTIPMRKRLEALSAELAEVAASAEHVLPAGRYAHDRNPHHPAAVDMMYGTTAERRGMVLRALAGRKIVIGPGKPAVYSDDRVGIV